MLLTVKDIRRKIKDLPDDALVGAYVGGCDAQYWCMKKAKVRNAGQSQMYDNDGEYLFGCESKKSKPALFLSI